MMTNIEKMSSISRIGALHKINNSGERFLMHIHNNYEIYVSLSNNNKFFIGHRIYDVNVTTCFCSTIRTHIKSTLSTPTTTSVTSSCFRLSCFPNPTPNCTNCSAVATRVSKTAATNCPCCLNNAIPLLREGLPVSTVALKTGFGSDTYFISTFKKNLGFSPKKYLK